MTADMEFYYDEIDNDVLILAADGGLNAQTADAFVGDVGRLIDAGLTRLIIDCTKLTHITSYGLGVLVRLHGKMKQRGGHVKICAVRGVVPQAMRIMRLDTLIEMYPDVNRARLAFRPPHGSTDVAPAAP
ncbi:MAG: STAS domain-containing protein [Planctomycetes bacterium]|nr:STAS domain-containing protein [Planctomycetota bacterium]